jgi:hypothetical protein
MKKSLSLAFWQFVLPGTLTASFVITILIYNSVKQIDKILLELYLTGEMEKPIQFSYKDYLEDLESYNDFININNKTIEKTGNSKIHTSSVQSLSRLRGGKNFGYLPKNWKQTKSLKITGTGLKAIAIIAVCGTLGATTFHLTKSVNELQKLTAKDIAIIKDCIDEYCKSYKINFLQLTLNKKLWESFINAVYLCVNYNLSFRITREQYFVIVGFLNIFKSPAFFSIFKILTFSIFSLGLITSGVTIYLIVSTNMILATLISTGWSGLVLWDVIANQNLFFKDLTKLLKIAFILVSRLGKNSNLEPNNVYQPILPNIPQIEKQVPKIYYQNQQQDPYRVYGESKSLTDILDRHKYYSEHDSMKTNDLPTIEYNKNPSNE